MDKVIVEMDPDVKRVCDFMMYGCDTAGGIDAGKLMAVARAVAELAPVMWGHHVQTGFYDPPLAVRRIMAPATESSSQSLPPQAAT